MAATNVIECAGACSVTVQLEPAPANPDHLKDLSDGWTLFFGVAIVVVLLRKLHDIFDRAPHGE